jgi:2-C-methyl-D-erythritol 4-phosphate cytidylyltransferase
MEEAKKYALIVAGGTGSRMNSTIPKQFMLLKGLPVLMHTINRFVGYDQNIEIIVVLPSAQFNEWQTLCDQYHFTVSHKLVPGGSVRFESVKNGLDAIGTDGLVAIHDGVRPLVSIETIDRCFEIAGEKGNAIPALTIVESIRKMAGDWNQAVDRSSYVGIQTPQTFRVSEIKMAYKQPYDPTFTDDSMVLECWGKKIQIVDGNRENIKITHSTDLIVAEALINMQQQVK